jgi:hypothetical protein
MRRFLSMALVCGALAGCGMGDTSDLTSNQERRRDEGGKVTGEGGLFNMGASRSSDEGGGGLGVNSFLWRASLDTISFMPLASADPFGGVIITDWYSQPTSPNERFKVTVYILSRALRADAVRVAVFRQARTGDAWVDQSVATDTAVKMEDAILTKARQIRIAQGG